MTHEERIDEINKNHKARMERMNEEERRQTKILVSVFVVFLVLFSVVITKLLTEDKYERKICTMKTGIYKRGICYKSTSIYE